MMMNPRITRGTLALFLLIAAGLACGSGTTTSETDKANKKLVDEGNAAVQDAKKFVSDAEAKKAQMMQTDVRRLAEARVTAAESIAAYDRAAEKCKAAAQKYDEASRDQLSPADLTNRKTHEANHNANTIENVLAAFRKQRSEFVRRLDDYDEELVQRKGLHPRLNTRIRVIDHIFFVAEHDDHHLARISELKRLWGDAD